MYTVESFLLQQCSSTSNFVSYIDNKGYSDSVLIPGGVRGRGAPNETNYCQVELWPHSHEKLSIWLLLDGLAVLFCFGGFLAITTLPCQKNKTVNTTSIHFFMQHKIEVIFFNCHTFSWTNFTAFTAAYTQALMRARLFLLHCKWWVLFFTFQYLLLVIILFLSGNC